MNKTEKYSIPLESAPATGTNESETSRESVIPDIVICDECGDSLWDAVLEQEDLVLKPTVCFFQK